MATSRLQELTEPAFVYVTEVAKQRGAFPLRHTGLTETKNTCDQEFPLTVFSFNENISIPKSESHSVKYGCWYLFSICLGLFSSLKMELNFQRRSVYYLIQIYIPSGMIVVLSWVSLILSIIIINIIFIIAIIIIIIIITVVFIIIIIKLYYSYVSVSACRGETPLY